MTIGELARATGCKVTTIRYYEQIGLLPEPARSSGNRRIYGNAHRSRLTVIQHCRTMGFPQSAVRGLLELIGCPDRSCEEVTSIAEAHLDAVTRRIAELTELQTELSAMIDACKGGSVADCRIVGALEQLPPEVPEPAPSFNECPGQRGAAR